MVVPPHLKLVLPLGSAAGVNVVRDVEPWLQSSAVWLDLLLRPLHTSACVVWHVSVCPCTLLHQAWQCYLVKA